VDNLLNYSLQALTDLLAERGEPAFRAKQVFQWLWQKGAADFEAMTNLSKALRAKLAQEFEIRWPEIETVRESADGTIKLLLKLSDGERVETVLIPEKDHYTQCLSSQVGCALECSFCVTGTMGLKRNLSHGEICAQIVLGRQLLEERGLLHLRNLVFMGMGEPLMNFDNLAASLTTIAHDLGLGFSTRRVTVSTAGIPGRIQDYGKLGLGQLAVSLHAPTQELREQLMPKAAKMLPLDQLMAELKAYPLRTRERIFIEYILIKDVNDTPKHARDLVRCISHIKCKVNLIAANPGGESGTGCESPDMETIEAFEKVLWDKGFVVVLRKSKGQDIEAACGQLATQRKAEENQA
jgi:23S rRNA (adenine2503-C2)-methyltransferase